ncbi:MULTISPECIES: helix-turn-helix domain-containing protein [Nocardiopsis]|jgi:DNA-binding XRE family transcriptional regulator|uniref:Helix-turn-helix domain-containing protein n=2 Tax=Nocardiopsis alba TaxID=53437 RepID=A0ABV5DWH3_9ACTN|nr:MULTISPECIES: helix-turn-helix domain-containing protein [Nocardiopsis]AFR06319.1 helix-turn-helix family protein [Nocardiopsis alba ATCC BAA-2165]MEC3893332.1 helix-turn-helix domain-containing protein [Nocardiopsis sp. LDBS1602]
MSALARTWGESRAEVIAAGGLDEERITELGRRMRAAERAYRLAEIRRRHGIDQTTLAEKLGVSQSRVSRIERGEIDRSELATIKSYVEALGGTVEIVARFGDEALRVG